MLLELAPVPRPKLMPFESPKTMLARLLEVVPAEMLTGDGAPAGAAAVMLPSAESPKLTPPPLPKAPETSEPTALRVSLCEAFQCAIGLISKAGSSGVVAVKE